MNRLRFEDYTMPVADLGDENPLPVLPPPDKTPPRIRPDASLSNEDLKYFGYGKTGILPHCLQDGYSRRRQSRRFIAAVLENDILRATFLPELGGRLWSLIHKPSDRELLFSNPGVQLANLAIRNAWFCGGVEWNMGVVGHNPQTCSPVFAARVAGPRGEPALRLYEWDRTRCAPYQIDAYLPDGSPMLYIRIGLVNPHDREIPMYWWSNIAVEERRDVRVLSPATEAITQDYNGGIGRVPVPIRQGVVKMYAINAMAAGDWFFLIPDGRRRWVAALDGEGRGLVQTSTDLLRGRKLFVWGMGPGGRHWQEFLSEPGRAYIEIQAGLARTQMECLPMPAGARWSWLEAYGLVEADAARVHGANWGVACDEVEARLERTLPREQLQRELALADHAAELPPAELAVRGSGWGALERRRRAYTGQRPFAGQALPFPDDSLSPSQAPWLALLETGEMPLTGPEDRPPSWMIQDEWVDLLIRSLRGRGDHWLSRLHFGVVRYCAGRREEAKAAWEQSICMMPSAWAYRNLAVAAHQDGRELEAADLYLKAHSLLPDLLPLAIECLAALVTADRPDEAMAMIKQLPRTLAASDRVRYLEAKAAVQAKRPDTAIEILQTDIILADIREGENSLSELWFEANEQSLARESNVPIDADLRRRVRRECPPPRHLDFRMRVDGECDESSEKK